jgi:hypothetical protein
MSRPFLWYPWSNLSLQFPQTPTELCPYIALLVLLLVSIYLPAHLPLLFYRYLVDGANGPRPVSLNCTQSVLGVRCVVTPCDYPPRSTRQRSSACMENSMGLARTTVLFNNGRYHLGDALLVRLLLREIVRSGWILGLGCRAGTAPISGSIMASASSPVLCSIGFPA